MLSLILPVYNQHDHIRKVVEDYGSVLAKIGLPYEVLLVDNGSNDGSTEICLQLANADTHVRFSQSEKGWGNAVKTGLRESKGDLICYTNSSRTHAKDLALVVLYASLYPDAVVKATRTARENLQRRLGAFLYNLECRILFQFLTRDVNGTPKLFPRRFTKLLDLKSDKDLIDAEFNAVCRRENYPVMEVPIFSVQRHGGQSTTNYASAVKMYWGVFMFWRKFKKCS